MKTGAPNLSDRIVLADTDSPVGVLLPKEPDCVKGGIHAGRDPKLAKPDLLGMLHVIVMVPAWRDSVGRLWPSGGPQRVLSSCVVRQVALHEAMPPAFEMGAECHSTPVHLHSEERSASVDPTGCHSPGVAAIASAQELPWLLPSLPEGGQLRPEWKSVTGLWDLQPKSDRAGIPLPHSSSLTDSPPQ